LIFFTAPRPPESGGRPDVGVVAVGVVADDDGGDRGESARELERELSDESLDDVGLILSRSPPSIRKCWSRMELHV
jgi:hypothetical protein